MSTIKPLFFLFHGINYRQNITVYFFVFIFFFIQARNKNLKFFFISSPRGALCCSHLHHRPALYMLIETYQSKWAWQRSPAMQVLQQQYYVVSSHPTSKGAQRFILKKQVKTRARSSDFRRVKSHKFLSHHSLLQISTSCYLSKLKNSHLQVVLLTRFLKIHSYNNTKYKSYIKYKIVIVINIF